MEDLSKTRAEGAKNEYRMAWMWVEGWRARLKMAGDVVEKEKWNWEGEIVKVDVGDLAFVGKYGM